MEMMCTGAKYADFFVWSPTADSDSPDSVYHLERISKDPQVCELIIRKSYKFFLESILPELMGRYYTNVHDKEKT